MSCCGPTTPTGRSGSRLTASLPGAGARVEVAHVPLAATDDEATEAVLAAVGERTRLAVIDQVTSPTARRLPLVDLVPALQARGVAVLVDGAHAPGMLAVEVDRLGADFWAGNLHKWCFTPRGTAVLHAAPRWREHLLPLVASWREPAGFPDAFTDVGTDDLTAWLSAPRALRVMERLGFDRLRRHNAELAVAGQVEVAAALELAPEDLPRDPAVSMQLVPLPGRPGHRHRLGRRAAGPDRRARRPSRSPSRPGRATASSACPRRPTTRQTTTGGWRADLPRLL